MKGWVMKKNLFTRALFFCIVTVLLTGVNGFAFEDEGLGLISPAMDMDFVVMRNNQSTTVTADLAGPFDFGIIPVVLHGNGRFTAKLSRTNTHDEVVYLGFYGFGTPIYDINIGTTPVSMSVSSEIYEGNYWGFGVIFHGFISSLETPPYAYNINLTF
jgi:hypothetical protein